MDKTAVVSAIIGAAVGSAVTVVMQSTVTRLWEGLLAVAKAALRAPTSLHHRLFPATYPPPRIVDVRLAPLGRTAGGHHVEIEVTFSNEKRGAAKCDVILENCRLDVTDGINWRMRFERPQDHAAIFLFHVLQRQEGQLALPAGSRVAEVVYLSSPRMRPGSESDPERDPQVDFRCRVRVGRRPKRALRGEWERVKRISWSGSVPRELFHASDVDERSLPRELRPWTGVDEHEALPLPSEGLTSPDDLKRLDALHKADV